MGNTAVFAGTFDPFTLGHYDVTCRAAKLFDKVVIAVSANTVRAIATIDERLEIARAAVADIPNVEVKAFEGFLTDFAVSVGAKILVRGLRTANDFEYEKSLFGVYRAQADVECVYIITDSRFSHISGTIVRELATLGGNLDGFVLPQAKAQIEKIYRREAK